MQKVIVVMLVVVTFCAVDIDAVKGESKAMIRRFYKEEIEKIDYFTDLLGINVIPHVTNMSAPVQKIGYSGFLYLVRTSNCLEPGNWTWTWA